MLGSNIYEEYGEISDIINGMSCDNVGLMIGEDTWEYPYWVQLRGKRIEHVNVKNDTSIYEDVGFVPECIILDDYEGLENGVMCHGIKYSKVYESDGKRISLWTKQDNFVLVGE